LQKSPIKETIFCKRNRCIKGCRYMYVLTSDVYGGGLHLMCISFAKEPYKRDDILQKRPIILRSLLTKDSHLMCMGWLWLVGSLQLLVSFAKEPYKTEDILQKRLIIFRSLLIEATPYVLIYSFAYIHMYRVAKTHRIPYLDRSISAKVSYI